jgi:sarcosine oxidase, subunit alpha
MGERRPGRFTFAGRAGEAAPGTALLEALGGPPVPPLARSVRYHRPRAPFCGVGYCTGCLVRVDGRTNVRACRYPIAGGERVETENSWPNPRFDLLGALDLLFPAGVDTLHGFRRPVWAAGLYQRVVRRLSGYGRLPDRPPAGPRPPPRLLHAPAIVVGGGSAGSTAAADCVRRGLRPVVLDRGFSARRIEGAETLAATTAVFLPPPRDGSSPRFTLLASDEAGRAYLARTDEVVVATGSYDAGLLFEGNDRPGVMTGELANRLTSARRRPPFRQAIVVGGGARATALLERFGEAVDAIVAPGEIRPDLVRKASELDVPLYPRTLLVRARGRRAVRSVDLRTRGAGPRFRLSCDAVVLAHRRLPNAQLLFQAGARMTWRPEPGAYFPEVDDAGRTSVPGLRAAGSVAGAALRAGAAAPGELEGYYRELLQEPREGKWIACACEDVLLEEVEGATAAGFRGIEVVKRYSGLGTGLCQGRYCVPDALLLLAIGEGRPPAEVGYLTQRPPVVPTRLDSLASLHDEFVGEAAE